MADILLFADLQEVIGEEKIVMDVAGKTVMELKTVLLEQYPSLSMLEHVMVAVNEEYSDDDMVIHGEDVIALIPPVSGG